MGTYQGDPGPVDAAVKAFLTALATTPELLADYFKNRRRAIEGWFDSHPEFAGAEKDEAIRILVDGDFETAQAIASASSGAPAAAGPVQATIWVTGWVT